MLISLKNTTQNNYFLHYEKLTTTKRLNTFELYHTLSNLQIKIKSNINSNSIRILKPLYYYTILIYLSTNYHFQKNTRILV